MRTVPLASLALATMLGLAPATRAQICSGWNYELATHGSPPAPWCATAGDLDGDGSDDIVLGTSPLFSDGRLELYPNLGNGLFGAPIHLTGAYSPRSVALGDLDGDGDLDLVVSDAGRLQGNQFVLDGLRTYLNDGAGGLSLASFTAFLSDEDSAEGLRLGDLDGDGDLDAAVILGTKQSTASSRVLSFLNDGRASWTRVGHYPAADRPTHLAMGDWNGDGFPDYATVSFYNHQLLVVMGQGDGSFQTVGSPYNVGIYPTGLEGGDFDGDGDVDLVVGWKYGISLLQNQGGGSFVLGALQAFSSYNKNLVAADFDQDGALDLFATFANGARVLRNGGAGVFTSYQLLAAGAQPYALAVGDWNGDGSLDCATGDNDGSELRVWSSQCGLVSYCNAKLNSQGCLPLLQTSGVPSASSGQAFTISADQVLNRSYGALVYGFRAASIPYLGGTLCIEPPLRNTRMQRTGGSLVGDDCSGRLLLDFNAWIRSGVDPLLSAGATFYLQGWYRDRGFPPPQSIGLTDALHCVIQP